MTLKKDIRPFAESWRREVNAFIECRIKELDYPEPLREAVFYSASGGKRLRAVFIMLITELFGGDRERALKAAAAIELFHSSLLILDDLPSMDDATMRRGRRALHLVYGEDTAILASLALINLSLELLNRAVPGFVPEFTFTFKKLLQGQTLDLHPPSSPEPSQVEEIYFGKTGSLFRLAAFLASSICGLEEEKREALENYASKLGVAYQIVDDVIDAVSTPARAGKDTGKDRGKPTLVALVGLEKAQQRVEELVQEARLFLERAGFDTVPFMEFAGLLVRRSF